MQVRVVNPGRDPLQRVKVVEAQGRVIDVDAAVDPRDGVVSDVPRTDVGADVLNDVNLWEEDGPDVEVLLGGEAVALQAVEAPLDAAVPPPVEDAQPSGIGAEWQESYVVFAPAFEVAERRAKTVLDEGGGGISHGGEDALRAREEVEI